MNIYGNIVKCNCWVNEIKSIEKVEEVRKRHPRLITLAIHIWDTLQVRKENLVRRWES